MTYQVLARKWRPRSFADLTGQEHVVRALVNALERGQLHHAYLFTGTRGVGKTTIARILAKTLNCETGIGPSPCGVCATCREIDEGRFVDLIEVDAASRTKVDQTRELLDNVPFAPVRGRSKVYLIDEVHMFSASSFNALLKTLEEPPGHVKFILATTDPQKLPATVLSRCLQFNLKRLLPDQIQARFRQVLDAEAIAFDEPALQLLARAADGSMRDGLSLLDQAIAFGGGRVTEQDCRVMLGTRVGDLNLDLLDALADADGPRLLAEVGRVAELTPDFAGVLKDLIALLHRLALAQQVPETLTRDDPDYVRLDALALRVPPEDVQLFYQVLLLGQQDLPLAPDPRAGLEMILLRALAFRPDAGPAHSAGEPPAKAAGRREPAAGASTAASVAPTPPGTPSRAASDPAPEPSSADPSADRPSSTRGSDRAASTIVSPEDWHRLVASLDLGGLARELAQHCSFVSRDGKHVRLALDPAVSNLRGAAAERRLQAALAEAFGCDIVLELMSVEASDETPARRQARRDAERQADAEAALEADPIARDLAARFDAQWIPGTIRATD